MDINTVYEYVKFLANKNQGGYISPNDFNLAFNMAQRQYFNFLVGSVEQFQYGRPIPRVGLGMGERVSESLAPFVTRTSLTVTAGAATKPTNLYTILAVRLSDGTNVRRVEHNRLFHYIKSAIDSPSASSPIYSEDSGIISVLPTSVSSIQFEYLKQPTDVKWAYTIVSNRPVYDAGNSVNPQWDDSDIDEIIMRTLGIIGINLKDGDLIQVSNQDKVS